MYKSDHVVLKSNFSIFYMPLHHEEHKAHEVDSNLVINQSINKHQKTPSY